MSSEQEKNKNVAGFAGLSSLVSDVEIDTDIPKPRIATTLSSKQEASSDEQNSATNAQGISQPQTTAQTYQAPAQPADNSSWKWILGIGAVIVVIWMAAGSNNKSQTSPSYSSSPSPPAYSPPAASPSTNRPSEETPPAGANNALSSAQLRYCLAEDIRLESAKTVVNKYIESDVDRLNKMVSDYNSRCSQFRYRKGALESARSEVDLFRAVLQADGRERFTGSSVSMPTPEVVEPTPDPTVQSIQQQLNALGYDAGSADGFIGSKTRSAIRSFQRDLGLTVDGNPSEVLLRGLESAEKPTTRQTSPQQASPSPQPPAQAARQPQYVTIPENSSPSRYAVDGWSCNSTFKQVGNKCVHIEKPQNSSHSPYASQGWSCNSTFRQVGERCEYIEKPPNSSHSPYASQGWSCNSTFRQVGERCEYIEKPPNSSHSPYASQGWSCNSGYKQVGGECLRLQTGQ